MKSARLLACVVACGVLTALAAPQLAAQQQPVGGQPVVGPGSVVIVDMSYIFKTHEGFQAQVANHRREVETVEADFKTKRDEIMKLAQQLEDFQRGSPEFKQLEENVTKQQADLGLEAKRVRERLIEGESKLYYNFYQHVLNEVQYYAESNHISLVLRFNGDEPDQNDPQAILKDINKGIVYYNRAIDITPVILERLRGGQQQQRPAAAPPTTGARPGVPPRR